MPNLRYTTKDKCLLVLSKQIKLLHQSIKSIIFSQYLTNGSLFYKETNLDHCSDIHLKRDRLALCNFFLRYKTSYETT